MSLPTLYKKGKLEAHKHSESQAILDEYRPLDYIMNWFEAKINKAGSSMADRIMILKSSTGSGKSSVLPPEFYHKFFDNRNIAVTQPRRLTTMTIPKDNVIPFNTKEYLTSIGFPNRTPLIMGENIGFQNSMISKKPVKGIIYMTVGTVQQQLKIMSDEDFMNMYSLIIIDEVHVRNIDTDFTIFMIKQLIHRNYDNPICPFFVTTSATFDIYGVTDYLLADIKKPDRYKNIIKVAGLTFPIEVHWPDYDSSDYIKDAAELAIKLHKENMDDFIDPNLVIKNNPDKFKTILSEDVIKKVRADQEFRDILIFVGGADGSSIKQTILKNSLKDKFMKDYPVAILSLTSAEVAKKSEDYINITKPLNRIKLEYTKNRPVRRIMIATNVAETGITIESLKYVIDTGFQKSSEYNPIYRVELLVTAPVTQGMSTQRKGRAGRKAPGVFYPLYTKATYDAILPDEYPEIIKSDVTANVLSIIASEADPERIYNKISIKELLVKHRDMDPCKDTLTDYYYDLINADVNLLNIDLMSLPTIDSMHNALDRLYILGAINQNCTPTPLGLVMNKFRFLQPEAIRMIMAGYAWGAPIIDLITIAAFITHVKYDKLFDAKKSNLFKKAINDGKISWAFESSEINFSKFMIDSSCDFIMCVIIWHQFQKLMIKNVRDMANVDRVGKMPDKLKDWCESVGINYFIIEELIEKRDEIIHMVSSVGFNPYANNDLSYGLTDSYSITMYIDKIKQCIYEGYKTNIAVWDETSKIYKTRIGKLPLSINKYWMSSTSDVNKFNTQNPKYIMYSKILYMPDSMTNYYKPLMEYCSVVDGFVSIDTNFDLNN